MFFLQSCDTLDTEAGFQEEPKKKQRSSSKKFFQRKERHKDNNGVSERQKDSADEVVIGRFEENNGVGERMRISGSGFEEEDVGGERMSSRSRRRSTDGRCLSGVGMPNGIYCTSLPCCQDCPETFLGGGGDESCSALLSVEREEVADVKEVEEAGEEVEKEVKSCEEYNLQIVSQV